MTTTLRSTAFRFLGRCTAVLLLGLMAPPAWAQTPQAAAAPLPTGDAGKAAAVARAEGFGEAVAADGDVVMVGEPNGFVEPGAVTVYRYDAGAGTLEEVQRLRAREGTVGDAFGAALALEGGRAVVGAPGSLDDNGLAYVFERDAETGLWTEQAVLAAADPKGDNRFGEAVALGGDRVLVGAPRALATGAVYAFGYDAELAGWVDEGVLTAVDGLAGDRFGWSAALSGGRALVGAPYAGGQVGAAYPFVWDADAGRWDAEPRMDPPGEATFSWYGWDVAVDGEAALVGAPRRRAGAATGTVLAYTRQADGWAYGDELVPSAPSSFDTFGWSVALRGDAALAGTPYRDAERGGAFVFRAQARPGTWAEEALLQPEEAAERDQTGLDVALTDGAAVLGGPRRGLGVGRAYLYAEDGGTWTLRQRALGAGTAPLTGVRRTCTDGRVATFDCDAVDLLALVPLSGLGAGSGVRLNDLWGWTDPRTGVEYALVGREDGTAFVDLRDPLNPVFLGSLPLREGTRPNTWRDVKTLGNYALVVADNTGPAGMQVFDLSQLRDVTAPPVVFEAAAVYDGFEEAHNVVVNEATGFAYAVGTETCGGGLHMIDLRQPLQPTFAGCFADERTGRASTGYTHDAQCVVYQGPDTAYQGREICFGANETAVSIADVTDKEAPVAIAAGTYPTAQYVHQGWLSEDHRWFFQNDELDEANLPELSNTRTIVWDVRDLDDPVVAAEYLSPAEAIDHNLYVRGDRVYQANYTAGLRVLDVSTPTAPVQVGFFDTVPGLDSPTSFAGAWSVYPYYASGVLAVSSREQGLFVLVPSGLNVGAETPATPSTALTVHPNPFGDAATVTVEAAAPQAARVAVYDVLGRLRAVLFHGRLPAGTTRLALPAAAWPAGTYVVRLEGAAGTRTATVVHVR